MTRVRQALTLFLAAFVVTACSDSKKEPTSEPAEPPAEQPPPAAPADPADQPAAAADGPYDIVVEVREESYDTFVDVRLADHERPALDYRGKGKRVFVKWDKTRPQADQVADVSRMLERLYAQKEAPATPKTLSVGLYYAAYPDYVARLARHAQSDPEWTRIRLAKQPIGEPRIKALHDYIEQTTRREKLHPELDAAFAVVGKRVELRDVEKCSTAKPGGQGELGAFLEGRGVPGKVKLPAGCLMSTFRIEAK
jgi:hypothetical protein